MLWFDKNDEMVAFNMAHHSGLEGWMGPLAVRPDRQGSGVGTVIVKAAIDWLRAAGVTTLGLETMPRTVENIGFYGKLGFVPGYLTMTMTRETGDRKPSMQFTRFSDLEQEQRESMVERCRESVDEVFSGYDFTREFELSIESGIGDAVVVQAEGKVAGFALWHAAPLAHNRSGDELRVLKLFADSLGSFEQVVLALESCAKKLRLPSVAIRCQTAYEGAYRVLTELAYRVRWTDLRMTLGGYAEPTVPGEEILFSNWEI
jgi:N-acetylglutamate synthase-like GNAT family acetyltransferase